jgi:hypothetical protein
MFVKVAYKSFTLAKQFGPVDLLQKFNSLYYIKHIGNTTKVIDTRDVDKELLYYPDIKTIEQAIQAHPEYFI